MNFSPVALTRVPSELHLHDIRDGYPWFWPLLFCVLLRCESQGFTVLFPARAAPDRRRET
jgi:hypothetical protein